jgi:hypothetical protein
MVRLSHAAISRLAERHEAFLLGAARWSYIYRWTVSGAPMTTHRKGPRKSLEATYEGRPIKGRTNADIYAEVLQRIGLEYVAKQPLTLSGEALVSRHAPSRASKKVGDWYIATHSDTAEKHSVLVRLKQRLGLDELEVRLTECREDLLS